MKEHHEELLQDVAQISHQYNELKELLQIKQMMIVVETAKSIVNVNQYFDIYINELRDTQHQIIANMEREKQTAQDYVLKIDSDLRTVGGEIQGLTKESIVQMTKAKNLSTELKKIEQQLRTYQVTRTENSVKPTPEFSLKFDCSSVEIETPRSTDMAINERCQTDSQEPSSKSNTLNMLNQSSMVQKYATNQPRKTVHFQGVDNDSWISNIDENNAQIDHIDTSHNIDRMASDGKNVLYTSYYGEDADLIVYCVIDSDDGDGVVYRDWKQSRIEDVIWWGSIGKFICATNDAIYTVDYANRRFKITAVIRGKWSYTRVAANTHQLFIWTNPVENDLDGIVIYSTQFECIRTIDLSVRRIGPFLHGSTSFCVTENLIASVCIRKQNNREVFLVTFCDMDMNKINSIPLGRCNDFTEIRTDNKDRFFITTGRRQFYIVRSDGAKQMINLRNGGSCIAVLNHQRVAVSLQPRSIEILTY